MSGTPSYNCELQSVDCKSNRVADQTEVFNCAAVQPKLKSAKERIAPVTKSTGSLQARQVEMDDISAKRNTEKNGGLGLGASDTKHSTDNQTDNKEHLADDDGKSLMPNEMIIDDEEEDIPNAFNLYRNKKLISHGMMDVALFSANANQLRYVLESYNGDIIPTICITLLLISIFLQILVGIGLLLSARYNVTNCDQRKMAYKFGNYVIVGIFLITVVNIFITAFGGPSTIQPTIMAAPLTEPQILNYTNSMIV